MYGECFEVYTVYYFSVGRFGATRVVGSGRKGGKVDVAGMHAHDDDFVGIWS